MLNKSIVASKSAYIIFIDGDCILHPHFIDEHYLSRNEKATLSGRRVNLSQRVSKKITTNLIVNGYLKNKILMGSFWDSIKSDAEDVEQGVYVK